MNSWGSSALQLSHEPKGPAADGKRDHQDSQETRVRRYPYQGKPQLPETLRWSRYGRSGAPWRDDRSRLFSRILRDTDLSVDDFLER